MSPLYHFCEKCSLISRISPLSFPQIPISVFPPHSAPHVSFVGCPSAPEGKTGRAQEETGKSIVEHLVVPGTLSTIKVA